MSLSLVINHISNTSWTNAELNQILEAVRLARDSTGRQTIGQLELGHTVTFWHRGQGRTLQGRVTGIHRKNVDMVTAEGARWRVPANLLTRVADLETV